MVNWHNNLNILHIYIWARDNISINYVYREGFMDIRVWSFSWKNDRGHPKDDTPLIYQIMRSQEWKLKLSTWLFIRPASCRFGFQLFCSKNDREDQKVSKCRSRFLLWQSFLVVLLLAGMAPRKRQSVRFDARTGFLLWLKPECRQISFIQDPSSHFASAGAGSTKHFEVRQHLVNGRLLSTRKNEMPTVGSFSSKMRLLQRTSLLLSRIW